MKSSSKYNNRGQDTFGKRFRRCRELLGLSQQKVAEELNVTTATISKYEKDQRSVASERVPEIAKVLHTTVDYLLDGKTENHYTCSTEGLSTKICFIKRTDFQMLINAIIDVMLLIERLNNIRA